MWVLKSVIIRKEEYRMRVFENEVLRRMFGHKMELETAVSGNSAMRS
jgi:hypothetical protein